MNASVDIDTDMLPAEANQLVPVRSLQTLAVVTAILGLLSTLALTRTMFWVLPLVTLILGAISLRQLASDPTKCGRVLAIGGMVLALLFGTWAPSRYFTRQRWLSEQARNYGDAWIKLIQERKFQEAHQLHGLFGGRAVDGQPLDEFYRVNKQARDNYAMFFGAGPLEPISQSRGPIQVKFVRVDSLENNLRTDQVVLRYDVAFEQYGRPIEIPLRLILRRSPERDSNDFQWHVDGVRGD